MTINFSLNRDDMTAWQAQHTPKSTANWWWLVVVGILCAGFGFGQSSTFFFWVAVGALLLALQPHREAPLEALGMRSISLEQEGIRIHSPRYRRLIFWEACQPLVETETHLFLTFAPKGVIIIPRRAFATPEACAHFRSELLRRNLWSLPQAA